MLFYYSFIPIGKLQGTQIWPLFRGINWLYFYPICFTICSFFFPPLHSPPLFSLSLTPCSFSAYILSVYSKTSESWRECKFCFFFYLKYFSAYVLKLPLHNLSSATKIRKFNSDMILLSNPHFILKYDELFQLFLIYLFSPQPGIQSRIIYYALFSCVFSLF